MKRNLFRFLLIALLIGSPLLGFSKYCPSCLKTYQAQTLRGQAQLLYRWMMSEMDAKQRINRSGFKTLLDPYVKISINGSTVAFGISEVKAYFHRMRSTHSIMAHQLRQLLIDQNNVAIEYQTITSEKKREYHHLTLAILKFKGHKLRSWYAISYRYPIAK